MKLWGNNSRPVLHSLAKSAFLIVFLVVPCFFAQVLAQSCNDEIKNNNIELRPAVCINTVALLQGATPTGGNGKYSYQWEMSHGNCGENDFEVIKGATERDYAIPASTSRDACYRRVVISGGCKTRSNKVKVGRENLTSPVPPSTFVIQPTCLSQAGAITVKSPAPAPGITYSIDGVTYTNTTGVFTDLKPGVYAVAARFPAGCVSPTNFDTLKALLVPSGSISPSAATLCEGASVTLSVSGGTSYQWYRNGQSIQGATAATLKVEQAGTYTADILTASCQGKAQNEAVVKESIPVSFTVATTNLNCAISSGTITISNPTGGSGFLFSIDNGNTFQKENTFSNLPVGTYKVVVKDGSDCRSSSKEVTIASFTPTLKASVSSTNVSCGQKNGSVTVTASGGVAPYQYSLDGGVFQPGAGFTGLSLGAHKLVVKDAGGCTYETSVTIIQLNSTLAASVTVTNANCKDRGAVTIRATGGTAPYVFKLDEGAYQLSASYSNLSPVAHKVTVKDSAGCVFDVHFEIKQTGNTPTLVVSNPANVCAGSTASLQDSSLLKGSDKGLTLTYWKDSITSIAVANPAAVPSGTYYIKATNKDGCSAVKPIVVSTHTPIPGRITAAGPVNVCEGQTVLLRASNGKGFQWYRNDTAINGATDVTYRATVTGTYTVLIDDGTCKTFGVNSIRALIQPCIINPETAVFVPSAFTPNKNGANDVLRPLLYNIASLQYFKVYNRWGQLVFQTTTMGKGWDGTINGVLQPGETFTWILACTDTDGNIIKQSGRSLLIR